MRCDGFYKNTVRGGQIFQENGRDSDLCPSHPDTYEVLVEMFKQIIAVFGEDIINIGGDEVRIAKNHLGNGPWWYCKRCEDKIKEQGWGMFLPKVFIISNQCFLPNSSSNLKNNSKAHA